MSIITRAAKGVPKDYHFDGEREMGAALAALLSPDLFAFEVQLPMIRCDFPLGKHKKSAGQITILISV